MTSALSLDNGSLGVRPPEQVPLVDLLDRLLSTGVVLTGDLTISIAGVDLVDIKLHALIASVRAEMRGHQAAVR